jgi:hypothetical protein
VYLEIKQVGSFVEFNDSLVISTEQGFPADLFDIKRQKTNPVTLEEVENCVFTFYDKKNARIYHLDPVRVFLYQFLQNEERVGKWLAWGEILIQSQTIAKNPVVKDHDASDLGDPNQWVTSGSYKMLKVFDPDYQRLFTLNETPAGLSYFGVKCSVPV